MPVRKVTDPSILQQLGTGQVVAPNPMFPGQMQGQSLNNTGQGLQNAQLGSTLPYAGPKAAAEASNAQTTAGVNAATAPAKIMGERGTAQKQTAEGISATTNLQVSGGADSTQAKNAGFYNSALKSNQIYLNTGIKDDPQGREFAKSILPGAVVNQFTSAPRQTAETARDDFIRASLRLESGAAIGKEEYDRQNRIFFPQPGDKPETVAAKAQLRQNEIDGLRLSAGPAAPMLEADYSGMVGGPDQALATGATRNVSDPGATAALTSFIKSGAPYDSVVAYAQSHGFNPPPPQDYAAGVAFAKKHHGAVDAQAIKAVPVTPDQQRSAGPEASLFVSGLTGATAGLSDLAGRAMAGPTWDANRAALSATNPKADLAGSIAGQASFEGLLAKLAGGLIAKPMVRRGVDAAYGGTMGASENPDNPLGGAVMGAGANTLGGMMGRGVQSGAGKALSGVKNAHLQYLDNRQVPLTLGQIARGSDNTFGHAVGGIEERMAGMPVADAIIGTARRRGDQGFNDEMFRQIAPGVKDTGAEGLAQARAAETAAYAKLGPVRIATDSQFDGGISAAEQAAHSLDHHANDVQSVIKDVRSQVNNGEITGKGYQTALQAIRKTRSTLNDDVGGKAKDALDSLEAEVMGLGQRQSGQVGQDLASANAIHSRIKIAETALKKAQSQNNDELISPRTLNQASISNTERFGGIGKALSPDRPFYDLTDAGKSVMPNLTPDSGTAGRAMLLSYLAGGVTGGGVGFAKSDKGDGAEGAGSGALKGLTLAALLAAPYSKVGQKGIQKLLLGDRPQGAVRLGDFLISHKGVGGLLGSAMARHAAIRN